MANGLKDNPVLDTAYTWQFYPFLSPLHINLSATLSGLDFSFPKRKFTYCDIGAGNAVTTSTLAACYPQGEFFAIDLNPEHVENGKSLLGLLPLTPPDQCMNLYDQFTDQYCSVY